MFPDGFKPDSINTQSVAIATVSKMLGMCDFGLRDRPATLAIWEVVSPNCAENVWKIKKTINKRIH